MMITAQWDNNCPSNFPCFAIGTGIHYDMEIHDEQSKNMMHSC